MGLFISTAYAAEAANTAAQATQTAPPGQTWSSILLLVALVVFIYFLMWRPQTKRLKEHRNMISALQVGDEIVTNSGVLGKVEKIEDDFLKIKIAENTIVSMQKAAVSSILPKGTIKTW